MRPTTSPPPVVCLHHLVHPKVQYPARPLKSKTSELAVPVAVSLVEQCSAQVTAYGRYVTLLTGEHQGQRSPWAIEHATRKARSEPKASLRAFRYHGTASSRSTSRTRYAGCRTYGYAFCPAISVLVGLRCLPLLLSI